MQQLNKISILETVALMRGTRIRQSSSLPLANSQCFSAALFQWLKINIPINATVERISILEDCRIAARNAHTSIVEFAVSKLAVFFSRTISVAENKHSYKCNS